MSGENALSYGQQIKRNLIRVFVLALILLIAYFIYSYVRDGKDDAVNVPISLASMGEEVSVNGVSYVAENVREATEYNGKTTENKFVIVTLTAVNNGKQEAKVYSELFYLYDRQHREYKGDVFRDSGGKGGFFGYADPIAPGLKKSGEIAFEVPANSTEFKFAISDSMVATKSTKYTYIDLR